MRGRCRALALSACILASLAAACSGGSDTAPTTTEPRDLAGEARSGGDATVFDTSSRAFAQFAPTLSREQRRAFAVGNNFFNDNWVTAPASTEGRDGLGPLFNAQSCSSCHFQDGRGAPPLDDHDPERGLLLRLSVPAAGGGTAPEPNYGDQIQDRAIQGVVPEGRIVITRTIVAGSYADGTPYELAAPSYTIEDLGYGPLAPDVMISPRIAPPVFGVGLLEAVEEATILAAADPDDADGNGISGRPNWLVGDDGTEVLGRFGWKANVPTVLHQTAGAFQGDIGITSALRPGQPCTSVQDACATAIDGGSPEIDDHKIGRVDFYTRTLAVPARRDVGDPTTDAGAALFSAIGCASCHTPEMTTSPTVGGPGGIEVLAGQTIRPYTDLLLHDMGPGLADDRPDGSATGSEWRTPPLWGIGLTEAVNGHTRFLHDGRARDLAEAVLWHGGEADAARARFAALPAEDRDRLLAFLESL